MGDDEIQKLLDFRHGVRVGKTAGPEVVDLVHLIYDLAFGMESRQLAFQVVLLTLVFFVQRIISEHLSECSLQLFQFFSSDEMFCTHLTRKKSLRRIALPERQPAFW